MKKFSIILLVGVAVTGMVSCSKVRRNPGRAYMPDMYYSRAYETYASTEELKAKGVHYNGMPVTGTVARGDMFPYTLPNDSAGLNASSSIKNPLTPLTAADMQEAGRLYMVNCAICHGAAMDGNGPLYNNGQGPYQAAPANLMSPEIKSKPDGNLFHVITYGKGQMGPYAPQMTSKQRWMVVHYLRYKMSGTGDSTGANAADTTAAASRPAGDTTGSGN